MNHGRQLRLFLSDGSATGPRFYEIVNRTIQALAIPVTRVKDLVSGEWPEVQKPGVYLVHGTTDDAEERLYIGKAENVANRVQGHPEKIDFDVTSLLLCTSKDENLNASQVGWLESFLVSAAKNAKRITIVNKQTPAPPALSKAELATVQEFLEDLKLIAQTAGFDYFSPPKLVTEKKTPLAQTEFYLKQPSKGLVARGYPSDEGFVVYAGSDASQSINPNSLSAGYASLREKLVAQGVLVPKPDSPKLLSFSVDYAFSAPSAAAAIIIGNNASGNSVWKTRVGQTLGSLIETLDPSAESPPVSLSPEI